MGKGLLHTRKEAQPRTAAATHERRSPPDDVAPRLALACNTSVQQHSYKDQSMATKLWHVHTASACSLQAHAEEKVVLLERTCTGASNGSMHVQCL